MWWKTKVYESLDYIKLDGVRRKVPEFAFLNQDSIYITNEDFLGKVYVAEFFFTTCPLICVEMNQNMKILDEEFGDRKDFGIASFTIVNKSSSKRCNFHEEASFYAETNIFSDQIVPGWIDFDDGMDLRMHHLLGAFGSGPLSP